jgi:hypothetical protein
MGDRLFVSNFGFEDELSGQAISRTARAATMGLCGVWAPMMGASDQIAFWCVEDESGASGSWKCPRSDHDQMELVPWGWSPTIADLVESFGSEQPIPDLAVVERVNRRRWAFERESELRMCPLGAGIVESIDALRSTVAKGHDGDGGWVVKSDLGGAGRGQRRIYGATIDGVVLDWVTAMLNRDGLVVIEPWLESIKEVGLQYEIESPEKVRRCGVTELLVTGAGGYRGSRLGNQLPGICPESLERLLAIVDPVVAEISRTGYTGPLGIDSMWYRLPSGELSWRPLQDINARHTMGRCALEWTGHIPHEAGASVMVARWPGRESVDRRLADVESKTVGLFRASRFSPQGASLKTDSGLVLLVYDPSVEVGQLEDRVMEELGRPG